MSVSPIRPAATPRSAVFESKRGARRWFGLVPRRRRSVVRELVEEQTRISTTRSAGSLTHHEAYVRSTGTAGSADVLHRGAQRLEHTAKKIDEIDAEVDRLRKQAEQLDQTPLVGSYGESLTAKQVAERQAELTKLVLEDAKDGSLQHARVDSGELKWLRRLTWVDFPVLLFFFASFFNVDWQALGSLVRDGLVGNLVNLLFALVFAALGTRFSALGLASVGRGCRRLKDNQGQLAVPQGKAVLLPAVLTALAMGAVLGLSTVMAYRIVEEAENAGVGGAGPILLGITYGLLVALISALLVVRNFQDGSQLTDQIDHLGAQLAPIRQMRHELHQQINHLEAARTVRVGVAVRAAASWRSQASHPVQAADQLILLARGVHQGCGSEAELAGLGKQPPHGLLSPAPAVDSTPLDTAIGRIEAGAAQLPNTTSSTTDGQASESTAQPVTVNSPANGHPRTVHITVGIEGNGDQDGASS